MNPSHPSQLELTLGIDWKVLVFPVGKYIFQGVSLINQVLKPEWRLRIDRHSLDMEDCQHCVLSQLFGNYGTGCWELGLDRFSTKPSYHGFNIHGSPHRVNDRREFEALRRGWLVVVERNLPTDCLPPLKIAV